MSMDMTSQPSASFQRWLEAFQLAYEAPERVADLVCPNCGAKKLALRFVIYGTRENEGHIAFWCDNCLHGVALGPTTIPPGGDGVRREDAHIPRYMIVPPTR